MVNEAPMTEDFLHYIWTHRLAGSQLLTTRGEDVTVLLPGVKNLHSGPDFLNARIRIGDTLWAGNVEIHLQAKDWLNHGHHHDPAYNGVILHVVYEADVEVFCLEGIPIPALELRGLFPDSLYRRYLSFCESRTWIPCASQVREYPSEKWSFWLQRVGVERFERKTAQVSEFLSECRGNWEEVLYRSFAGGFGAPVNSMPFIHLSRILPFSFLRKYFGDQEGTEALVFGQAGLLDCDLYDDYPLSLRQTYAYLKKKHNLSPMHRGEWKSFRMRPTAFPAYRLAFWTAFWLNHKSLLNKIIQLDSKDDFRDLFRFPMHPYWEDHYRFDSRAFRMSRAGDALSESVFVNAYIPYLMHYGKVAGNESHCLQALAFLEMSPPEQNHLLVKWKELGIRAENLLESQALLELHAGYCEQKKCLNCDVGSFLVSGSIP